MKINRVINKIKSRRTTKQIDVTDPDLVLVALCAYRDHVTMTYDISQPEVCDRLEEICDEIGSISNQIFAMNH